MEGFPSMELLKLEELKFEDEEACSRCAQYSSWCCVIGSSEVGVPLCALSSYTCQRQSLDM